MFSSAMKYKQENPEYSCLESVNGGELFEAEWAVKSLLTAWRLLKSRRCQRQHVTTAILSH